MGHLKVENLVYVFVLITISIFSFCEKEESNEKKQIITIISPNGGEAFIKGESYPIEWNDDFSTDIRIKLYKSGTNVLIVSDSVNNSGKFNWMLPEGLEEGRDYTIKISSNNDDFTYSESEEAFTIIDKPSEFSEFTDERDGQTYRTIKIGSQWWMAENFNYAHDDSYCYDFNSEHCNEFGRLYSYEAASTAAPTGWKLPSDRDWKNLEYYLGITADEIDSDGYRGKTIGILLSEEGGLGFNAKYAGYSFIRQGTFNSINSLTYFWSSTSEGRYWKWARELSQGNQGIKRVKMSQWYYGLSVRYIKDE